MIDREEEDHGDGDGDGEGDGDGNGDAEMDADADGEMDDEGPPHYPSRESRRVHPDRENDEDASGEDVDGQPAAVDDDDDGADSAEDGQDLQSALKASLLNLATQLKLASNAQRVS